MSGWLSGWACVGGIAVITVLMSCFTQLRNLYKQLISRIVVNLHVSGHQADAVLMYAKAHFNASRFGSRAYTGSKLYFRPARRVQLLPMEVNSQTGRLYWRQWRPIWIAQGQTTAAATQENAGNDEPSHSITVTYARGTMDADSFIRAATDYYNLQTRQFDATGGRRHSVKFIHGSAGMSIPQFNSQRSRGSSTPSSSSDIRACLVNRPLGFSFEDVGLAPRMGQSSLQRLALSDEALQLVDEVKRWRETERWHYERHLPWRRGFLLYGSPGTGKTALARAIAEDLDLPVHVFDLASLKNDELQKAWNQMLEETPCMALMEDIDAVFHGRKNIAVASGPALTFDCLLNVLDGVQRADGLLTIMTTNHIELVDPAIGQPGSIGSRPGRIDRVVKLGCLSATGRQQLARRILADYPETIESICQLGSSDTPAQFQERCTRLALALHYGDIIPLDELEGQPTIPPSYSYFSLSQSTQLSKS